MKKCDIIIVVWNQLDFTRSCIQHIAENTRYPYRLIAVDNGSDSGTRDYLEDLKSKKEIDMVLLRNDKNLGFVKAANQGLRVSEAPYVCILNNDTLPGTGWLTGLVEFAEKYPDSGLLNPLCEGHEKRNLTVNEYARKLSYENRDKYMEMNQCQGFCMLIKREVIQKIGYLDEGFGIGGFDDTDYSLRAHMEGYKCICVYSSYVYHWEHISFNKLGDRKRIQAEVEKRYFKKWPRHKRLALIFSVSNKRHDREIANFLKSALFLAREWCWVNLMIFGDRDTKNRIESIRDKILPLHQNLKFNYLNPKFKILEITARILERSFGRKKRKKYDAVICDKTQLLPFLRFLCSFQNCNSLSMDFSEFSEERLKKLIKPFHKDSLKENGLAKCDIILPVCDEFEFIKKCIESIIENTNTPYRLIIINNGKDPETKRFLDGLSKNKGVETKIIHNNHNTGWVKALNQGIELSGAPYICFQNSDTIVTRGWLKKMINILRLRENFGMINPTWGRRPGDISIENYNSILEKNNNAGFVETDWCRGFCIVIKRAVIEKIGKVDESYGLGYLDDVDYSIRAIEAGFSCVRALDTYVYHEGNVTANKVLGKRWDELHERNKLICRKKWGDPLKIIIVLNRKLCKKIDISGRTNDILSRIEDIVFYLARRQHHIDIWSPRNFNDRFRHTNVELKIRPFLLKLSVFIDLYMNKRKRQEKRYHAVFNYDHNRNDYNEFIKETVDRMKEKTKEAIGIEA
ncbi:MAG: glycosyltransferase family 2 protein [Candidatus Omnitrophota bacterium]|nr:MAG: glycosyltransferase family 2 protein [Candidatus Omnitrophota bacterium]